MGRSATSPHQELPSVSFTTVSGEYLKRNGVQDFQARSYGFNDGEDWQRPESYVRYIEPLESELATQVEYDMDEQDQEWLEAVNKERKTNSQNRVSYEIFEVIMDRLEKGWFDLTKNLHKSDMPLPSEDATCAICDDSEVENTNAIVFCDGCNLAVHQDCYGVPYIPEGQWLCRKCTVSPENPVSCLLCPNEGGAFKQSTSGEWIHLLCAIWIPETRVANETFMEPITGTDRISKQRWRLKCSACDVREGACIQCTKSSCFLAFHVTCARKEKLLMPMKAGAGQEPPPLQCFCEKHLPRERIKPRLEALEAEAAATALLERDPKAAKAARAYAKGYKPGPPIVPSILIRRIERYVDKVKIRGASEFIEMVARYWSLKREARRGAPLLKRLHLEPWTASAGGKVQTDEEKSRKLELMKALRADLERVKQLVDQVRRREIVKRDRAQTLHGITSAVVFAPIEKMRVALLTIEAADKHSVFKNPVSHAEAPGYYEVVKRPMCWSIIEARLDGYQYWDLKLFKADINLIFDNAMAYNVSGSPIHKLALRLKNIAAPVLEALDRLQTSAISQIVVDQGELDFTEAAQSKEVNPLPTSPTKSSPVLIPPHELPIGDLEPPFELLSLFKSPTVANESAIVINSDPLDSFFSHELPVDKPKPPPRSRSAKRKDRKLSTAKTKADALDASPGFRAPARRSLHTATGDGPSNVNADPLTASSGDAHVEPNLSAMPEEPKRRKPKQILPGQDSSIVEDVSNQDSFKKFNSGWILPENARRNGRRAPDYHISGQSVPRGRSKNSSVRAGSSIAASSPLAAMRDLAGQPDTQLESSPLASAAPRLPSSSDGPVRDVEPSISATPSAQINLPVTNSPAMESSLHLENIAREERDLPSLRPAVESTLNAGSASGNTEERAYEFSSFPSSQPTDVSTGSLPALDVTSLSLHALSLEARPPSHTEGAQLSSLNRPTSPYLPIEPPFTVESNDSRFEPPKIANTLEQAGASTSAVQQPASNLEDSPGANPADESFSHHDMSLSPVKSPSRNGLSSRASSPLHASQEIGAFDDGQPTQEWDEDPLPGYAISSFEVLPPSPDPSTPQSERQEYSPREWLYSLPGLNDIQSFASGDPAPPQPSIFTAATGDHTTEPRLSVLSPSALPLSLNDLSREATPHPITETEAAVPPVTHSTPPASQRSSSPLSPVPRLRPLKPNEKLVYDPDGTAVIEEIDSPTARRQNQLNRRNRKQDDVEMISLSNGKAQGKRKKTGGRKGGARGRASASGRMTSRDESVNEDVQHEDGMLDPSKKVEGGTLVWAKSKSWPFFPAVVWEVDNPAVPKAVLKEYEKQTKSTTTTVLVVQFFDRKRFWSAVDMKNLRLLFDYPDVDAKMLSPRNCNSRMREQIRQAYRQAQAEIEDEGASVAGGTPDVDNATDDIETAAGHADVEMESALSDAI